MPHKPIRVHHNKIRTWDWLLILGLTIAPMTGLRIWKIGPAEVLTFIWCLRFFPRGRVSNGALMRFFLFFFGLHGHRNDYGPVFGAGRSRTC